MATALSILAPRDLERGPVAAAASGAWRHWRLARDEDGVAWLVLDKAAASANTLSEEVLAELDAVLTELEREPPKGLVLRSGKRSGFIAGADIGEFRPLANPPPTQVGPARLAHHKTRPGQARGALGEGKGGGAVEARLTQAHAVVDRLDRLAVPTVAVIHGYCLGGGLEIALACDYRIAVEDARLGFPEVMLGLHPGLGGTVRLPRLINPLEAMTMMLTGRNVRAARARSLGLVDAVVPERHVEAAAAAAVARRLKARRGGMLIGLVNSNYGRKLAAKRMRAETARKAPIAHYPAPHALIDLWEAHGGSAPDMQKAEISSFARLVTTDTSRNLVRVFFLREQLKADGDFAGRRVHVVGAGAMGGDIAAWCAWHGFTVTLADMKTEPLAQAVKRAADLYGKIGHKRTDTRDALDRLIPDRTGEGVRTADLVIEAVPEELELKRKVYAWIEPKMRPAAILATNTSSIPLEELRTGLQRPDRLVGVHFFNPVSRMQLVELVSHDQLSPDVSAKARAFLGRIDRLAAPVKSAPGFLVNRALTPYMLEAMVMVSEGVKRETIDAAAVAFGMPMGPIELADTVGLDICLNVAETLKAALDRPMPDVSHLLRDKVARGELGRKTGKGLYDWKTPSHSLPRLRRRVGRGEYQPVKARDAGAPTPEMTDRLILPMLDVCVACLGEGVVKDEDTIDGAMIFATGFAPFRGGPLHYARSRGIAEVRQTLWQFSQRYGERFRPDPHWNELS